ncbi:hypothetical protein FRC01_009623, partial [Tulasnella sp. 417]
MYRGYQSRSFLEPLPSGSGTDSVVEIRERTPQAAAWSDTLEELQEAIPFLHDLEPGYQLSSAGLLEALVLAGPANPGDRCVDDVLWLTMTFKSELKKSKAPTTREPSPADYPIDPIIDALQLNHRWGVPFALIADERFGVLPLSLRAPYTVLGWYHVCGVGEPSHTFDPTSKRPTVKSSWTFRFRPAESQPESGGSSSAASAAEASSRATPMLDGLGSNGRNKGKPSLNWPPLLLQQTEDVVMEPASTDDASMEHQPHDGLSAPTPVPGPSLQDPLVKSVLAMCISENVQSEPLSTELMEVDPVWDAPQPPSNLTFHRGQRDTTDPPEAEIFAEYANAMIVVDERGRESLAASSTPNFQAPRIAGAKQPTTRTLKKQLEAPNSSRRALPEGPEHSVPSNPPPRSPVPPKPPVGLVISPSHRRSSSGGQQTAAQT